MFPRIENFPWINAFVLISRDTPSCSIWDLLIKLVLHCFRKDSEQTKQIEELQKENEDLTDEKERLLEEIERILSETGKIWKSILILLTGFPSSSGSWEFWKSSIGVCVEDPWSHPDYNEHRQM